ASLSHCGSSACATEMQKNATDAITARSNTDFSLSRVGAPGWPTLLRRSASGETRFPIDRQWIATLHIASAGPIRMQGPYGPGVLVGRSKMIQVIGSVLVLVCVLGGFLLEGGKILA